MNKKTPSGSGQRLTAEHCTRLATKEEEHSLSTPPFHAPRPHPAHDLACNTGTLRFTTLALFAKPNSFIATYYEMWDGAHSTHHMQQPCINPWKPEGESNDASRFVDTQPLLCVMLGALQLSFTTTHTHTHHHSFVILEPVTKNEKRKKHKYL